MGITSLVKYLADCYKADNREFKIENFFSSKYENQILLDQQEELINGQYPQQFLDNKKAKNILSNLQLYQRDKELFYCSFFLIGKRKLFNKKNARICAPIFFYPSEIRELDGDCFVKPFIKERRVNYSFLRTLDFKESFEKFLEDFNKLLKEELIDYPFTARMKRVFEKHIENVVFSEDFSLFPKLSKPSVVRSFYKATNQETDLFFVFPISGLLVSSKAVNIQNVVNELEQLMNLSEYSTALKSYLGESFAAENKFIPSVRPFVLNQAQEDSVKSANQMYKSVVVGPPGTGKTYTVASIAIDYLSRGKTVLIAAKTDEALQVISDKLESFAVGRYRMKAGGARYLISLVASLEKFLYKFHTLPYQSEINKDWTYLTRIVDRLEEIEKEFSEIDQKSRELTSTLLSENGIIRNIKIGWLKLFNLWQQEEWLLIDEYMDNLRLSVKESNKKLMGQVLGKIQDRVNLNRKELQDFVNSLRNKDLSVKSEELASINFSVILEALPIWLVKIDKTADVLPLQKEMFDLLIVDEATQCDMAGILPLLHRAKKMVVTGDPKQLRHVSFLSKQRMFEISKKHNITWNERLNYRTKSLLDFVLEQTETSLQVNFLNEHYRSLPDIIRFSNASFYDRALLVMNDLPKYKFKKSVFIHEVKGERDAKGINVKEASLIVSYIKKLIDSENMVTKKQATTIGVISPFKDQVTYLAKSIREEITLKQLHKHNIRLGTPYSFQGDERDVILISLAIDNNSHHSAINYLNRTDVFNVMITRARNIQEVYLSASIKELKFDSLLRNYIETSLPEKRLEEEEVNSYYDSFVNEVSEFLKTLDQNIIYYVGYQLSGLVIDVLIEKDGKYLGIDLIGYPGDFEASFSIERYKVLYRVRIQVIPLAYVTWCFDEKIKEKLTNKILDL